MNGVQVFHISHNDLDGYGSSYIVAKSLPFAKLTQYNVDYTEFDKCLESVCAEANRCSSAQVIITDIGFSAKLESVLQTLSPTSRLLYMDHHVVTPEGMEAISRMRDERGFEFIIDYNRCATKIVYDYYNTELLRDFAECVDVYDRWNRDRQAVIDAMSFFSDQVYNCPLYFSESKRNFIYGLFDRSIAEEVFTELLDVESTLKRTGSSPESIDRFKALLLTCEHAFIDYEVDYIQTATSNIRPLPILQSLYLSELSDFECLLSQSCISTRNGYNVALVDMPSKNFQYLSAEFLRVFPNKYDVIVRLNTNTGNMSFRSAVGKARDAAMLFEGGGHLNAGGANAKNVVEGDLREGCENILSQL